jgi:type II secretory pathway component GspD/PulD (secretin)
MKIRVKPRIHADGTMTVSLDYGITSPAGTGLNEQGLKTTLHLKDGETVALGGLDVTAGSKGTSADGKDGRDRILVLKARVAPLA